MSIKWYLNISKRYVLSEWIQGPFCSAKKLWCPRPAELLDYLTLDLSWWRWVWPWLKLSSGISNDLIQFVRPLCSKSSNSECWLLLVSEENTYYSCAAQLDSAKSTARERIQIQSFFAEKLLLHPIWQDLRQTRGGWPKATHVLFLFFPWQVTKIETVGEEYVCAVGVVPKDWEAPSCAKLCLEAKGHLDSQVNAALGHAVILHRLIKVVQWEHNLYLCFLVGQYAKVSFVDIPKFQGENDSFQAFPGCHGDLASPKRFGWRGETQNGNSHWSRGAKLRCQWQQLGVVATAENWGCRSHRAEAAKVRSVGLRSPSNRELQCANLVLTLW